MNEEFEKKYPGWCALGYGLVAVATLVFIWNSDWLISLLPK